MAKRNETKQEAMPRTAADDKTDGRRIAELAGVKLDKAGRRLIYAGKVPIRVVPWQPFECWNDAMMAGEALGIDVVTVADGPRGLCDRILEAK